jgi:hypothetical protein
MTSDDARTFVTQWVEAWNAHDLDAILRHFDDRVTFTSPVAMSVVPSTHGVVRGKPALREYWRGGLELIPDLHFEIEGIYRGVDTLVIHYRNQRGGLICEVLTFDGPMVVQGHAAYLDEPLGTPGPTTAA